MDTAKNAVIGKWKTTDSPDFAYYDSVEDKLGLFWQEERVFRSEFDKLNLDVLEIACGKGRHSAQIADKCGKLLLTDTSTDAIAFTKERFKHHDNVETFIIEDGESLPFIADESVTGVFSYDSMVHFEPVTIAAYLNEIRRILVPGGKAVLHHSNFSEMPDKPFDKSPGWRNYMTSDLFRHFVHRAGLQLETHFIFNWSAPNSDALSLVSR
jgi:ubiquinone/menaquinone biosynthesis C-methylase UbiE